ncbi:hypothetical protein [Herbidospora sp. NBRC 101105]|uniref:hypothetical protein n=1 Tax=Herbidospora sp. NBRC 101105 TaxID=3032195 RepID=UPI0024A20E9A|nr:hypothetical protein [Herbidospora sp. NBRC 101105]GLX97124.1 hypothetical protein Hesp01_50740 [Herbidospora sp. NBRC 101105]
MSMDSDPRELETIPVDQISGWVADRYPKGMSLYSWWGVLESLETMAIPFYGLSPTERGAVLARAAAVVDPGVKVRDITPAERAYWLLRFASIVRDYLPPPVGVPDILTPDRAVEWALARLPLSRQATLAEIRRRQDDDDANAPAPGEGKYPLRGDSPYSDLTDTERVLAALPTVSPHLKDSRLREEAELWLAVLKGR